MTDSKQKTDILPPVEVPIAQLQEETLREVIRSFVMREGTDYGLHEIELSQKTEQVLRQLAKGEAVVVFDPVDETVSVVESALWQKFQLQQTSIGSV